MVFMLVPSNATAQPMHRSSTFQGVRELDDLQRSRRSSSSPRRIFRSLRSCLSLCWRGGAGSDTDSLTGPVLDHGDERYFHENDYDNDCAPLLLDEKRDGGGDVQQNKRRKNTIGSYRRLVAHGSAARVATSRDVLVIDNDNDNDDEDDGDGAKRRPLNRGSLVSSSTCPLLVEEKLEREIKAYMSTVGAEPLPPY